MRMKIQTEMDLETDKIVKAQRELQALRALLVHKAQ